MAKKEKKSIIMETHTHRIAYYCPGPTSSRARRKCESQVLLSTHQMVYYYFLHIKKKKKKNAKHETPSPSYQTKLVE